MTSLVVLVGMGPGCDRSSPFTKGLLAAKILGPGKTMMTKNITGGVVLLALTQGLVGCSGGEIAQPEVLLNRSRPMPLFERGSRP